MADYKKMYLTAVDAIERAMELLAEAEQACEELYIQTAERRARRRCWYSRIERPKEMSKKHCPRPQTGDNAHHNRFYGSTGMIRSPKRM